jgi:site-specific recombinase XerD
MLNLFNITGNMATEKTLSELQQEFVQNLGNRGRASATILAYRKDLEQLTEFLTKTGKENPLTIRPLDIEAFRDSLRADNYTDKSVSRKLNAVKTFFSWLVTQKVIENDPAAPVAHPRYENPPPRILSRMEYRALRDAGRGDVRISAIIELMLQTGVRIGEVANLRLEDIKDEEIVIRAYESQPERLVPLNDPAKQLLNAYLKIRPNAQTNHVFVTKTGRPLLVRNIRSAIDRYFKEAGIEDAKVNDLRNTFIAHQLRSGVDIVTVSKIAGHKRLSTTEHYLQFVERKEGKRGAKLDEL